MRELEQVALPSAQMRVPSAELEASRRECSELRSALSAICAALESWGQWTMPAELARLHYQATALLGVRQEQLPGF